MEMLKKDVETLKEMRTRYMNRMRELDTKQDKTYEERVESEFCEEVFVKLHKVIKELETESDSWNEMNGVEG